MFAEIIRALIAILSKRRNKRYRINTINTDICLENSYRFRYKIYCETDNLLDKKDYPDKKEKDNFDAHSTHFLALDAKDEVVGNIRLIRHSKEGFPTEEEFEIKNELDKYPRKEMVELSRFMIDPDYRGSLLFLDLCKTAYRFAKENDIKYFLGCGEQWFINIVRDFFGDIDMIGEPKFCFNAQNYAFVVDLDKMKDHLKRNRKLILLYFETKDKRIII